MGESYCETGRMQGATPTSRNKKPPSGGDPMTVRSLDKVCFREQYRPELPYLPGLPDESIF